MLVYPVDETKKFQPTEKSQHFDAQIESVRGQSQVLDHLVVGKRRFKSRQRPHPNCRTFFVVQSPLPQIGYQHYTVRTIQQTNDALQVNLVLGIGVEVSIGIIGNETKFNSIQ